MKSWLRNLVRGFSRKPQPVAATTWHAEDFQPAPEKPAVADPWAPEAAPTALQERPPPAPEPAPSERQGPAAPAYREPLAAPAGIAPAAEGTRYTPRDVPGHGLPLFQQDIPKEQRLPSADAATTRTGPAPTQLAFRWNADQPSATEAASPAPVLEDAPDVPARVEHPAAVAPDPALPSPADVATSDGDDRDGARSSGGVRPEPEAQTIPPVVAEVGTPPDPIEADWGTGVPSAVTGPDEGVRPQPESPDGGTLPTDWDDFAPVDPPPPSVVAAAPRDDFDLPEYDPRLSQRLGDANWAAKAPQDSLARQRAVMIAALLEVTYRHEAEAALQWLEEFFQEHRWAATFRAIESAALEGLDFPTLRAMAELKEIWTERPEWWLRRVYSTRGNAGGTPTQQMPSGATALSWRLARRICLARCDYPPDEMIDCEWLAEWYDLPSHAPGAQFFTAFLQEKAEAMLAEALHEGLAAKAREYEPLIEAPHRMGPRRPLRCGAEEEMISPEMVDLTAQRQRKIEDDS